jgi:hypothetical protein
MAVDVNEVESKMLIAGGVMTAKRPQTARNLRRSSSDV